MGQERKGPPMDFDRIDKTIHEKGRLAIMTVLATPDRAPQNRDQGWPFQTLKAELKMSDGNLVSHLRTLDQAGYVTVTKELLDRPQTRYALTEKGRAAFLDYIAALEQIVRQARGG